MKALRLVSAVFFCLIASESNAGAQAAKITVGPIAGVVFSSFGGFDAIPDVDVGTRTGFAAGAFVNVGLNRHFSVEPQLLYVQKGATITYLSNPSVTNILDYVEVPLLAKGRYGLGADGQQVILSAFVGPAIAFNVKCSYAEMGADTAACDAGGTGGGSVKAADVDFSGVVGAGAAYFGFSVQARYDFSFSEAYSAAASIPQPKLKNRAWLFSLGYGIAIH